MMAITESHPTALIVENILKRNQMTPVSLESMSNSDVSEWFFTPQNLKRCLPCIKIHISEAKTMQGLRVRLDKGLGRQSRAYNVPSHFIMYEPWMYTQITSDSQRIQRIIDAAQKFSIHVWLQVSNGVVPGFNPFSSQFRHQFHWILNDQGHLTLAEPVFDVSEVGQLQHLTEFKELLDQLPTLREWPWYWATLSWGIVQGDINEVNASALLEPIVDLW